MDLYNIIYKHDDFFKKGKLDIATYQKLSNKYIYLPFRAGHAKHIIKNYVKGELKWHVRINTEFINFFKIKSRFYDS